jgi:hypothetical protein
MSTKTSLNPKPWSLKEIIIKRTEKLIIILVEKDRANAQTGR